MAEDEKYIFRCLQLARNGACNASPNPMVGAVIVHEGKIIGEGYHICCGQPHAEVNAISFVKDEALLKKSTLYVSLEPCSHYGKTPPCADLIIQKQIPRVVIGCQDPFIKVAGQGIDKLRKAGVEVKVGVLEDKCKKLIKRFLTFHTLQRPYILLKWAESADGYMDKIRQDGHPTQLSNSLGRMLVHKKRAEADAIMVGTHTALLDNPSLTVRDWQGKNPVRILIDKDLSLPKGLHLFNHQVKTIVFTAQHKNSTEFLEYVKVDFTLDILPQIMATLYKKNIQSILVEGGAILLQSFIDAGLWDEIYVEQTPILLYEGVKSPHPGNNISCTTSTHFGSQYKHYASTPSILDEK